MMIDIILLAILIARPSFELAAWVAALLAIRHTPALAISAAHLLKLDSYDGWTARLAVIALPPLAAFMSRPDAPPARNDPHAPIHVPGPRTADTSAAEPPDRDITKEAWIASMARAKDAAGKWIFSANQIYAAVGGHRASVLDVVRAIRDDAPAQFRDGETTAPASYPVSRGGPT